MKPKILFTASIPLHFKAFHLPYLEWFQKQGYETHVACNGKENLPFVDKLWDVPFFRSPFALGNISAYRQLKKIIDQERYVLIHCHTPMASVITRLSAQSARNKGTKVLYTAHGFHFYNGSPLYFWAVFYPVERFLSGYADAVITINMEDFTRIKEAGNKQTAYYKINGIGVDNKKFYPLAPDEKKILREKLGWPVDKNILVYGAEFIDRKNHRFIIEAVKEHISAFSNCLIIFAGKGKLEDELKQLVSEYKLNEQIKFVGFRRDINQIYQAADIGISSSKQEGLGINLVEAMMCGLPVVATVDRGHKEVIDHKMNGFLFPQNDTHMFAHAIELLSDRNLYRSIAVEALVKARKFERAQAISVMSSIYSIYLK